MSRSKYAPKKVPEDHHGPKTQARLAEELRGDPIVPPVEPAGPIKGHHRLAEHREQHGEAEKNSEKTRLHREVDRGHLDIEDVGDKLNG